MVSIALAGHSAAAGSGSANASSRNSPAVSTSANQSSDGAPKPKKAQVNSNGYHPPKPQVPLSALRSAPLDMASVERRGQPTASRETVKKSRPHGLQDAPTYQPTEEEFKDPMAYVRKIAPEARKYGICKIIPPESWNPDFAIDTEKFHFRTRKQELNSVEGSTRANLSYLDALVKYHKQIGNNLCRLPYVDKKPLDLYRLKKAVERRGGFDKVCKGKKWAEIGRDLGYSGKIMSSLSTSLKNSYQKWLWPYEEYLMVARPGVHQQLEHEYGGPFTPSPAPSPMKRSNVNTPPPLGDKSPARVLSEALHANVNGNGQVKEDGRDTPVAEAAQTTSAGGFTAINSNGFTPVNSGFASVNRPALAEQKNFTPPKQFGSPLPSSKNTPEYRPSALGPTSLKRQLSCESFDSAKKENSIDKDDSEGGSRRSKRLKKDCNVPTVAGSHMSMFRPSVPRIPRDDSAAPGERCQQCGKGEETSFMVVCETCDHGYHGACLDPPLKTKPEHEWNCPRCLVGDGQFGFEEGGLYSLKQFQQKAADFKLDYFEKRMPSDKELDCQRPITEEDVENEFWRLVASLDETIEVEYGADIHCTTHGSGFPTAEKNPDNPYSMDPWNLNILPLHPESLFRYIRSDVSGMTVPWVYVGMIFSTFCWHNEDHYSYSANYQHFGATKTWYGIPGEDAEKFEAAMREAVPELFETQPDLLFQLVTLLPPEQLRKAGVRVYALDQRAGQFVITFPQAYHAGFNHGFNCNEAVNFAPCDWEPWGLSGVERLQVFRKQPCFSHDELLWTAAEGTTSGGLTIQTARWLAPALGKIHTRESRRREEFTAKHIEAATVDGLAHACLVTGAEESSCALKLQVEDIDVAEEDYQCAFCKSYAYLSRFKCETSGKVLCLQHAGTHACCDVSESQRFLGQQHTLVLRKADDAMEATYKKVYDKAHLPEAWEEKYEKILDEDATPSLKVLRGLLNEGEKIPFDLPSLPLLREFVERCNHWVEEAMNYTVRKQQNRRKNDRDREIGRRPRKLSIYEEGRQYEVRDASNISRLIDEAELIGFDCPEIVQLRERAEAIRKFQDTAKRALEHPDIVTNDELEELLEEGQSFNVDLDEVDDLAKALDKNKWNARARSSRTMQLTMKEVRDLLEEARELEIPDYNDHYKFFVDQLNQAVLWEKTAQDLVHADVVHYPQLEALSNQATQKLLPVSRETLAAVDQILHKQREAQRQIRELTEKSQDPDYRKRPRYSDLADVMKKLEDLNTKPHGARDLEQEQKNHENWMRKGKKLFGKTNAPLHILKSHMEYVYGRNFDCFDTTNDKPRVPAEPASRDASPEDKPQRWESFREVFCICRRPEGGMMIECELCHEWYHGKCLKIARGKVKGEDDYICPICDWRVRIPRDAARPKLEDLIAWYDEIPTLPFQPEEEEVLRKIIENAQDFRNHISGYCNPILNAAASEMTTLRFYLRKIEGAEILLSYETNFFRQELHKWSPVAPEPPPVLEVSKSTRKPRPTKLQKLLIQYGVDDPDDLPESVKGKANSLRRKALNAEAAASAASGPSSLHSNSTSSGSNHTRFLPRPTWASFTPRFNASASHGHHETHHSGGPIDPDSSRGSVKSEDAMDLDDSPRVSLHPNPFMQNGLSNGPRLMVSEGDSSAMSLEDQVLNGQIDGLDMQTHAGKQKIIEILSRTEEGRKRAEEIFGTGGDIGNVSPGGGGIGPTDDNEGDVDKMFVDLVNQDVDEDGASGGHTKKIKDETSDRMITAESLEKERNGMDALLDGE